MSWPAVILFSLTTVVLLSLSAAGQVTVEGQA